MPSSPPVRVGAPAASGPLPCGVVSAKPARYPPVKVTFCTPHFTQTIPSGCRTGGTNYQLTPVNPCDAPRLTSPTPVKNIQKLWFTAGYLKECLANVEASELTKHFAAGIDWLSQQKLRSQPPLTKVCKYPLFFCRRLHEILAQGPRRRLRVASPPAASPVPRTC